MTTTSDVTWRRLRALIKRRDRSTCFHCGEIAEDGHCDHLIPLSKGGTDAITNLVWSCKKCNLKKGNSVDSSPDFESWLDNESPIEKPLRKSIFLAMVERLLRFFIPPYPEYSTVDFPSYDYYFDCIAILRSRRLEDWLRCILWPISDNAKITIEALDNFDREIAKSEKYHFAWIDEVPCNICGCSLQMVKRDLYTYSCLCPAGHAGTMYHTPTVEWISQMRQICKEEARIKTIYGEPGIWKLPNPTESGVLEVYTKTL